MARHRIALEIEVDPDQVLVEPTEWDLDDLSAAIRDGVARPVRVIQGRVTDEHSDLLSTTMDGWAEDLEVTLQLHWLANAAPGALIQPVEGAPRPSLETLVSLRTVADELRRMAGRLRGEGL